MINIIILICSVLAGFALGKFLEKRVVEKGRFYQDLTAYVTLLKDNVTGKQLKLSSFDEEFTQNSGKAFSDYILKREISVRLNKVQKNNLNMFFDNLDCVSSQAFVEHINYYGKILANDSQSVMQNEVAKAAVYPKLGMLLGAMVGILFV